MEQNERQFPEHINLIAIEGVIGAGKTALSQLLTEAFDARIVLEDVDGNPFLAKFYDDRRSYAFQTQLFFLLSRYRQLAEVTSQSDLFHRITVCDYMFAKDRIFASINLDDDELSLYNTIAKLLETTVPRPDLVVYLQTSAPVLHRRIEKRGRTFEFNMDAAYLDLLIEAYNHFFFHYTESPVLIINTDEIDFVGNRGDLMEIMDEIVRVRPGTNYYQPLGPRNREVIKERRSDANNSVMD